MAGDVSGVLYVFSLCARASRFLCSSPSEILLFQYYEILIMFFNRNWSIQVKLIFTISQQIRRLISLNSAFIIRSLALRVFHPGVSHLASIILRNKHWLSGYLGRLWPMWVGNSSDG